MFAFLDALSRFRTKRTHTGTPLISASKCSARRDAATVNARAEARDYLAFLRTSEAKAIFEKFGFSFLIRPTS